MKSLNWGKSILAIYIGFVLLMVFMVYMASKQDFDLVAKDYYQQEIEYQTKIDANKNQTNSSYKWDVKNINGTIEISLSNFSPQELIVGKVEFYRPNNSKLDITTNLNLNENGKFLFPSNKLEQGQYLIKINYTIKGVNYYEQQNYYHN
jgi:nitrogen fixation protein FixH